MMKNSKIIAAICIGNAMEWYDFMVYNFMLIFIAQAFFPSHNPTTSLLATMASSGVAFIVRPFGGILLGIWADRYGHHKALLLVFKLMASATLLITLTPSYAQIGLLASFIIVGARLLQGLATGGEFSIASTLLISLAPENKKGFYTSLQMVGQLLAVFLGSFFCFFLTSHYSNDALFVFAWRIPFAIGLLILPVGWILRRQIQLQLRWQPTENKVIYPQILKQKKNLFIALCLVSGCTGSVYTLFSYMPTFSKIYLHLSLQESYFGTMVGIAISLLTIPFFGALSDRIGTKPILITALSLYLGLIYPLLSILNLYPSLNNLLMVESILGLLIGAYFGVITGILAELFPAPVRSTCLAISYNSAVMLFGGFAPLIITALIEYSKNPMIFTYYLMIAVALSLTAALYSATKKEYYVDTRMVKETHCL
jgi:MHS family proline/betaine transporter-like MFS transporter